jgi:hypothetical protein
MVHARRLDEVYDQRISGDRLRESAACDGRFRDRCFDGVTPLGMVARSGSGARVRLERGQPGRERCLEPSTRGRASPGARLARIAWRRSCCRGGAGATTW